MAEPVFILGGYQTDFARNWTKESKHISAMFSEAVTGALEATNIDPEDVEVGHVGNFAAELYTMQGHLGAFLVETDPAFRGLPTARHEAACASGSIAILAAGAEIEAGRYDLAMVLGIEQMKSVDSARGGDFLGTAAWYEREAAGVSYPFPKLFGRLGDEYDKRFGIKDEHLAHIATINYANAKKNPLAQTRNWYMSEKHANSADRFNQVIGGRIKVSDCSLRSTTSTWTRSRRSSAGATTRRRSASTTRSPRARTTRTCCRTRARRSWTPSAAPRSRTCGASTRSRHTTASQPRSTWRSTTSA
jgi:acetyl-CoA C-acetyltransferase